MNHPQLYMALLREFHECPKENWFPDLNEGDSYEMEMFWLEHAQASTDEINRIVGEWKLSGKWDVEDDRTAYFLRLRIHRCMVQARDIAAKDRNLELPEVPKIGIEDRKYISSLLLDDSHEEPDLVWASEAAEYRSPSDQHAPKLESDGYNFLKPDN